MNVFDQLITSSVLILEQKIKYLKFTHRCCRYFAITFVSVSLWKLKLSSLKNKVCKDQIITMLYKKHTKYDYSLTINIATIDKKIILKEMK